MLVNNLFETFNSHILNYRDLPIIGLCKGIRGFLIGRIESRTACIRKCSGSISPTIKIFIDEREKLSRRWHPISNGKGGYQVSGSRGEQFVISLKEKACTYNL